MTKTYSDMLREGLTPKDVWPTATMAVTFLDGKTVIYKNVRVLAVRGYSDPVVVEGPTGLSIEAGDTVFHLLGVRQYVYEIDDDE